MGKTSSRVWLIDEIRGISILLMVLYHAGYDLVAIFGVNLPFFFSPGVNLLRDIMAGSFILISGVSCQFSHSNPRRGAITFGLGMLMTLVTAIIIPDQIIIFGILHCLGLCMLIYALSAPLLQKIRPLWGALLFLSFFYLTFTLPRGYFGGISYSFALPRFLYDTGFLFPFGFPSASFFSSDYYPLFPWLFLFLAGSFLGIPLKSGTFPTPFYRLHAPWLAFIGRNTLVIYLLHQPILYGLFSLIFLSK